MEIFNWNLFLEAPAAGTKVIPHARARFVCLLITIYGEHDDCDRNFLPHNWEFLLIRRRLAVILVFVVVA